MECKFADMPVIGLKITCNLECKCPNCVIIRQYEGDGDNETYIKLQMITQHGNYIMMFCTLFTIIFNYVVVSIIIWSLALLFYLYSVIFVNFMKMRINKGRNYSILEDEYKNNTKVDGFGTFKKYIKNYKFECIFTLSLRFLNTEYKVKIPYNYARVPYTVTKHSDCKNFIDFMRRRPAQNTYMKTLYTKWFNLRYYIFYKYPYAYEMLHNLKEWKGDNDGNHDVSKFEKFENFVLNDAVDAIDATYSYYICRDEDDNNKYCYFIKNNLT